MAKYPSKRDRNYTLLIERNETFAKKKLDSQDPKNYIVVQPPFTIDFDIQRNNLGDLNVASINIYNLSRTHRDEIGHDPWDLGTYQRMVLKAGYGNSVKSIFQGNIYSALSVRESVDFITTLEGNDGGFAKQNGNDTGSTLSAPSKLTFPAGTTRQAIIIKMMEVLSEYHLTPGWIGDYNLPDKLPRKISYSGNPLQLLRELTGRGVFVDNEVISCLKDGEYIPTPKEEIPLINTESGLIGTPIRQEGFLIFEVVFDPRPQVGELVQLESSTAFNYNGFCKVASVQHKGMISESVCGSLITTIGVLYNPSQGPALTPAQALKQLQL